MRYRVYFNTHAYADGSGPASPRTRIVEAYNEDDARQQVRDLDVIGTTVKRYVGMVHQAELVEAQS